MSDNFADRLLEAIKTKGTAACVGFDPVLSKLPESIRSCFVDEPVGAIRSYGMRLLEVVSSLVPVVKLNIAFFEVYRGAGVDLYCELVEYARSLGLLVIGDVKRGDIGHTSTAYAMALLSDRAGVGPTADAVTLNGYFGIDGIKPFAEVAAAEGKGLFVLVHTSNASAGEMQHLCLQDGTTVTEQVGRLVHSWGEGAGLMGASGFSSIGAVVAPGDVERARLLRDVMPNSIFLVPGFGAQGRSVAQVAACFRPDGTGAVVNSSRGVIYAYESEEYVEQLANGWEACVDRACRDFVAALRDVSAG